MHGGAERSCGWQAERRRGREAAPGRCSIGFLQPLTDPAGIERLAARGVIAFAMESIPRTTRAQSMDALSSQATVAGYKAVLLAADRLPQLLPDADDRRGDDRAGARARAGRRRRRPAGDRHRAPAGRSRLGFDVRPVVREQVQCLGATFLDLGVSGEETEGGYARELTAEEQARSRRRSRSGSPSSTS